MRRPSPDAELITLCHDPSLFFSFGVQINVTNKRVRGYSSFFGIKFGQWERLTADHYLTFLNTKETEREDTPYNVWQTYQANDIGIYLVHAPDHRQLFISNHHTSEGAKEKMKFFCDKMDLPFKETLADPNQTHNPNRG